MIFVIYVSDCSKLGAVSCDSCLELKCLPRVQTHSFHPTAWNLSTLHLATKEAKSVDTLTQTLTHGVTWDTPTNKSFRLRPLKPRCGCSVRFPIRCAPGCREPAGLILSSDMVDNVVKLAQSKLSPPLFLSSHKDTGANPCSISP